MRHVVETLRFRQSGFHGRAGVLTKDGLRNAKGVGGCDEGRIALGFEKAAEEAVPKCQGLGDVREYSYMNRESEVCRSLLRR